MRSRLTRRLESAGRQFIDQCYARFAVLVRRNMRPEDTATAFQLFKDLTDTELAAGTSPEQILERLPKDFADSLRLAIEKLLDSEDSVTGRSHEHS